MLAVLLVIAGCSSTASPNASGSAQDSTKSTTTNEASSTSTTSPPATTATPTTATTQVAAQLSLLVEPQAGMTPIYNFMSSAKRSLDMTMYELSDPTAENILIADHRKGVAVRVLLDQAYDGGSVNEAAYSTLRSAGVPVLWANDSAIFHQKTITVDDTESAIMTGNLTSRYYSTTRDFVVMDGQAWDVASIESVFDVDWSGAAPAPAPTGGDLVWSPGSEPTLAGLIDSASHSVIVENEEMDSQSIEDALESDARRGVDTTVVMTYDSEWDIAFDELVSSGVHVVLYPDTETALYIHAKVIDVDGTKAFIGSENFSTASLDYDRELGIITSSASILGPLNATLASDEADGQSQGASSQSSRAAPTTTVAKSPTTTTPSGCYPIDDEGGCYEPGEYCRDDDHGTTGRAGDGATIVCDDRNGTWYWEET